MRHTILKLLPGRPKRGFSTTTCFFGGIFNFDFWEAKDLLRKVRTGIFAFVRMRRYDVNNAIEIVIISDLINVAISIGYNNWNRRTVLTVLN